MDERFQLVKTFDLTVPENYNHTTRLAKFKEEHREEFSDYSPAITDQNFSKVTTKLTSGRKFRVKVFQIIQKVSSEDCLSFLKSQRAVLVGAQGASLVYELKRDELPVSRSCLSFDKCDALWEDAFGYHGVPYVGRRSGGVFGFCLGCFEDDWSDDDCLLCFCDSAD